MLYDIRMDDDEAQWIIQLFKTIQRCTVSGSHIDFSDDDVERMQSFIYRIRAIRKK